MARKKKSQEEPAAIVHTRAIFVKQSEELQKLIAEKRLLVEQAKADLAKAEDAYNVVLGALGLLYKKGADAAKKPAKSTRKKGKKKRKQRYTPKLRADVKRTIERLMFKTGSKYTAAKLLDILVSKAPLYKGADYGLVWYCIDRLVTEKKIAKVGRGLYQWQKDTTKKPSTTSGRGKGRSAWMDPADKLLAMYENLTGAQLQTMLNDTPGGAPSTNAIAKYLNRQVKKGNLKRVGRGTYAAVDKK